MSASSGGTNPAPAGSFASLDLLRGVSAAAVFLSHVDTFAAAGRKLLPAFLGSVAVEVFMLISGFLMMWHFLERKARGEAWGKVSTCMRFYTRRFFRIAPLYYLCLVIVYVLHHPLAGMNEANLKVLAPAYLPGPHDPTDGSLTVAHVLAHFSFAFGFIPRFAQSNPLPDWSIGLEMQFYLFFPFIALLLVRTYYVGAVLLAIGLKWWFSQLYGVGVSAEPGILGVFPYPTLLPFRIDCFLVGILFACVLYERENRSKRVLLTLLALALAGLYAKKFLIMAAGFILFEIALRFGTGIGLVDRSAQRVNRLMEHRFVKFLADTSYGVYLLHIPILIATVYVLIRWTALEELSPVIRLLVVTATATPFVYGLAWLVFRWIESPGNAFGHRLAKRFSAAADRGQANARSEASGTTL